MEQTAQQSSLPQRVPEHSPTPWSISHKDGGNIYFDDANGHGIGMIDDMEDAIKVVRAVNSHEALIEVAKMATPTNHSDPRSFELSEKAAAALESAGYIRSGDSYVLATEQEAKS